MLAHAVLAVLLSAAPAAAPDSKSAESPRAAASKVERTPHQWRTAVREALRRQATTRGADQDAAIRELVGLYGALAEPTQLTSKEQLQLRTSVRGRLMRTSKQLAQQLARAKVEAPADASSEPAPADSPVPRAILAQVAGNAGRGAAGGAPGAAPGNNNPNIFFQNQGAAGAGPTFAGQTAANAQQLIDLIQAAIAPASWQVNGGQGTIVYFAPKQLLVIRQTGAIHDQIGQAIQGLRGN